jgi:glucokinase
MSMMHQKHILVGDIGGTKINLGVMEIRGHTPYLVAERTYPCHEENSIGAFIRRFQSEVALSTDTVCIGGAGPTDGNTISFTNLQWNVTQKELHDLGFKEVWLINDLVAHASTSPYFEKSELVTLQEGKRRSGSFGFIAAGTGLGEALVIRHHDSYCINPSEGGHATFAPSTTQDLAFCKMLLEKYGHVSWERVVSGRFGFLNIASFLLSQGSFRPDAELRQAIEAEQDIGPQVYERALKNDPFSKEVIDRFLRYYGAEAGNLALKGMTTGGVFIGGGIIKQLHAFITPENFLSGFCSKGRFTEFMKDIPINIVISGDNALRGAAYYALTAMS